MKTKIENNTKTRLSTTVIFLMLLFTIILSPQQSYAHCDSYDGPVIKDAIRALETNNPELVMKWIDKSQEKEIKELFGQTYALKNGNKEIFSIVEKHFLETLVRLHRETEGAAYTGLKPAGTTKAIITMSDQALEKENVDDLLKKLNNHIAKVVHEKYDYTMELKQQQNESVQKGREYVHAYVEYTHLLEALHDVLEHGGGHDH